MQGACCPVMLDAVSTDTFSVSTECVLYFYRMRSLVLQNAFSVMLDAVCTERVLCCGYRMCSLPIECVLRMCSLPCRESDDGL